MKQELLFLEPVFTHNIWGGTKLGTEFNYDIVGTDIGECWGISAHPNGDCTIKNGVHKGEKLSEVWKNNPSLFGVDGVEKFPLLIKIIDAKEDLSIQVHPDDAYAYENENGSYGKTECWYVLECDENSTLVVGHNAMNKEELQQMVADAKWNELLREVPVKKGDFIQIASGMVHAIKGGIVLLETQQNSDITYRVYDYDRVSNGKKRPLHIEKSLDVIRVPSDSVEKTIQNFMNVEKNQLYKMMECDYYKVFKVDVQGQMTCSVLNPFMLVTVIDGEGFVNGYNIKKGDHFIVPNGLETLELSGNMQLITSTI